MMTPPNCVMTRLTYVKHESKSRSVTVSSQLQLPLPFTQVPSSFSNQLAVSSTQLLSSSTTSPTVPPSTTITEHEHRNQIIKTIGTWCEREKESIGLDELSLSIVDDYKLYINDDTENLEASIRCNCGVKLNLFKLKTRTFFQLSNFYAHLKSKKCSKNRVPSWKIKPVRFVVVHIRGKNVCDFVRMNLNGSLPSLPTLIILTKDKNSTFGEGRFRFNELEQHLGRMNTSIGFASEDCTGIVRKIRYDTNTNSFIGFCTPLENGIPSEQHFKTDSFDQVNEWFSNIEKAPLLNIHMFQPLAQSMKNCSPVILAAYGTDSKFTAIDIFRRGIHIYEQCSAKKIRIIGFSTDCDSKYLRAMQLVSEFFADLSSLKLHEQPGAFAVAVPAT
ncbi:unnamed protein product [Didymodactylos carnosus]|uniref:Uncharacterized protein n=1 Tax=Didymodactylos carnosus TaxID=1234261 RepID=A0A815Y7B8_9BILA|nr:unnamed protein product [Didymodactylos carnosus]CAF4429181.1 unnamed protein product [Didymodactylos carnosus]